ncbi:MAG TPA: class I SAM-dependent methyltransferase [Chitinophagaceae bacterium]|nr:class I SAM-dependent methyltransferase [Chitinophagaceae bacterium]
MYTSLQLTQKYLKYYFSAFNGKGHGTHSPFVFDFIRNVLNPKALVIPKDVEDLRSDLKKNYRTIEIEDLGAGSRIHPRKSKTISQLVATAVKPKKYGQLLFRLAKHYRPETIIELGTSLGLTTAYFATACADANLVTIEGSSEVHLQAIENFKRLQLNNINALKGNFDDLLPLVLKDLATIDLAYIDGNHRYRPTINYFHQLLLKKNNNTILVFDDIHWSAEMEQAWEEIKAHPSVACTIDIFFLGFVFFRNEFKAKQHFTIRY